MKIPDFPSPTVGERLLLMKRHSRLSLAAIAERGGWSGASSIQKLFKPDYDPPRISRKTADKLIKALAGAGSPPINAFEIEALTDIVGKVSDDMATTMVSFAKNSHYARILADVITTFHTRPSAEILKDAHGQDLQLFEFIKDDTGLVIPCPEHLTGKQLVGFFCSTNSLWPRFEIGELSLYEHRRPPVRGDDVLVIFKDERKSDKLYFIGRLAKISEDELEIEQLTPLKTFLIRRSEVSQVWRMLTRMELLPNMKSVGPA